MTRPFAVKAGKKRKRKEAKYDKEEAEVMKEEEQTVTTSVIEEDEKVVDDVVKDLPGIPITISDQNSRSGAIFVLERASLEVAKVGKVYQSSSSILICLFVCFLYMLGRLYD